MRCPAERIPGRIMGTTGASGPDRLESHGDRDPDTVTLIEVLGRGVRGARATGNGARRRCGRVVQKTICEQGPVRV